MGIFDKIKNGLTRTRAQLQTQLEWMVKGKSLDESAFDGIEEAVVLADAGLEAADALVSALRQRWKTGRIKTEEDLKPAMAEEIEKLLLPVEKPIDTGSAAPFVVLAIGVNGAGKTTTIAKLARIYLDDGKKVMFGACDTFRAAAIEQLEVWGQRLGIETIKHQSGSDPAAVAYDATKAARARGIDVFDTRHCGPPPHKGQPHGRDAEDKEGHRQGDPRRPARDAPGGGRDQRPERHRPGGKVQRGDLRDGDNHHQARRDGQRRLCPAYRAQA